MLLRLQQLDLSAVEHIQKTEKMRNKYLPGKNTFASLYCHYLLKTNPSGLIPVYSTPM